MCLNFVFLLLVAEQQVVHRQGNLHGQVQVVETLLMLQLLDLLDVLSGLYFSLFHLFGLLFIILISDQLKRCAVLHFEVRYP